MIAPTVSTRTRKRLEGKIAFVTGGNNGIGLASARRLHQEGAQVAITGRDAKTLDAASAAIGLGTVSIQADVSKLTDIERMFSAAHAAFGKIDVLFANAGICQFASFEASEEALFDELFAINVKGVFFTLQKGIAYLNDGASIILNSSTAAGKGGGNIAIYAATKAAVRSFTRTAARELQSRRIRVNAVAPGPIETALFGRDGTDPTVMDNFKANIATYVPLGRMGQADEVAGAVAFLASADASYITGASVPVDGGMADL
jgi:NAD(P)-dependent dehydrogenase (short-subunit alcohol dehydrogenase family)